MKGNPADAVAVRVEHVHRMGPPVTEYQWRCPICESTDWTELSRKTETCSNKCGFKLRSLRHPPKPIAQKRAEARAFVTEINARTVCAHCGAQPIEWHNPEHVEQNRRHFQIGRMVSFGK